MTASGTTVYPGIYKARCSADNGQALTVYVPQVFGTQVVTITDLTGAGVRPTPGSWGYVAFEGGDTAFPVWIAAGGNGVGGNEVLVSTTEPTDPALELWFDPSAPSYGGAGPTGASGVTGATGPRGATGVTGPGVPVGGATAQVLGKNSATDYDAAWVNRPRTLAYTKLAAAAATVTLAIPTHPYNTLEVVACVRGTGSDQGFGMRINGDASNQYWAHLIYSSNAGAPAQFTEGSNTRGRVGTLGSSRTSTFKVTLPDALSNNANLTWAYQGGGYMSANQQCESGFTMYGGVGPVTSLVFVVDGGAGFNFDIGSSFHVWGM